MSVVVCVDPGLRHLGLAVFRDGALSYAALVTNPEQKVRGGQAWKSMAHAAQAHVTTANVTADIFLGEEMPAYPRDSQAVKLNLLQLNGVLGAVIQAVNAPVVKTYYPREWKGNMKGDKMTEVIESRLFQEEATSIQNCQKSLRHNVIDAVGIGLKYFGRL